MALAVAAHNMRRRRGVKYVGMLVFFVMLMCAAALYSVAWLRL